MESDELTFLLLGKTGHGKSATGNCLLGKRVFKVSRHLRSETKEVRCEVAHVSGVKVKVVDQPGLADTGNDSFSDKEHAVKNMALAMGLCDGAVDVFLFVFKYGNRFTREEQLIMDCVKKSLGSHFLNHFIFIFTNGDEFERTMEDDENEFDCTTEEDKRVMSFEDWWTEQRHAFQQLSEDCEGRVLMINNREKDANKNAAQRQKILDLARKIKKKYGSYTDQYFADAKKDHEKFILDLVSPTILRNKIHEKISLLVSDIEDLPSEPSESQIQSIKTRTELLIQEIESEDNGSGKLSDLLNLLKNHENHLKSRVKLRSLADELRCLKNEKLQLEFNKWPGFYIWFKPITGLLFFACHRIHWFFKNKAVDNKITAKSEEAAKLEEEVKDFKDKTKQPPT